MYLICLVPNSRKVMLRWAYGSPPPLNISPPLCKVFVDTTLGRIGIENLYFLY